MIMKHFSTMVWQNAVEIQMEIQWDLKYSINEKQRLQFLIFFTSNLNPRMVTENNCKIHFRPVLIWVLKGLCRHTHENIEINVQLLN